MATVRMAHESDGAFVEELITLMNNSDGWRFFKPDDQIAIERGEKEFVDATVLSRVDDETYRIRYEDTGEEVEVTYERGRFYNLQHSPSMLYAWEKHQSRSDPDGVAYADGLIDDDLVPALNEDVQRLIDTEPVDYHPGSGTRVRDLVHPSLYPYVEGLSVADPPIPDPSVPRPLCDRFGRPFEDSDYQWLPTPFSIDADGFVEIPHYINNLDRARHSSLYDHLASLFSAALPLVESVVGYLDCSPFFIADGETEEYDLPYSNDYRPSERSGKPAEPTRLRGRELLVIPKLVEYRLEAGGETHEGVWHVEGMSHEHIVATCVYILHRDDAMAGGSLLFKRAYTQTEAARMYYGMRQDPPTPISTMVKEGTIPIGRLDTPQGRLIVFPNSHIHKLTELTVTGDAKEATRRVIVFWVVDPNITELATTREVAPQQEKISREEALRIRLELMEERKRHKQTLNVRAVSLCEH